jgi:hypothetical protein
MSGMQGMHGSGGMQHGSGGMQHGSGCMQGMQHEMHQGSAESFETAASDTGSEHDRCSSCAESSHLLSEDYRRAIKEGKTNKNKGPHRRRQSVHKHKHKKDKKSKGKKKKKKGNKQSSSSSSGESSEEEQDDDDELIFLKVSKVVYINDTI